MTGVALVSWGSRRTRGAWESKHPSPQSTVTLGVILQLCAEQISIGVFRVGHQTSGAP